MRQNQPKQVYQFIRLGVVSVIVVQDDTMCLVIIQDHTTHHDDIMVPGIRIIQDDTTAPGIPIHFGSVTKQLVGRNFQGIDIHKYVSKGVYNAYI